MADTTNPDVLALDRQRALAQMLLKKGMETPQGQMIGNRYVGAHPLQFLGNLAQQYIGQQIGEQADTEQTALAKKLKSIGNMESEDVLTTLMGQQGHPQLTQQGPMPTGGNIPIQPAIETQAPNPMAALLKAQASQSPEGRAYIAPLLANVIPKTPESVIEFNAMKDNPAYKEFKNQLTPYQKAELEIQNKRLGIDLAKLDLERQKEGGFGGQTVNNNGVAVGRYDKMGRYQAPSGEVYNAGAVNDARAAHDKAVDLAFKLNQITKDDIKNAYGSTIDYTTNVAGKYLGKLNPITVDAQTKINTIGIGNVLNNLSQLKGASSDKEMTQMIKDFPGFQADTKVAEKWAERAATVTNHFLQRNEKRFGFDTEYAQQGRFDGAKQETPKKEVAVPGAPKPGEVRPGQDGNYQFMGGDQFDQKNWKKVIK